MSALLALLAASETAPPDTRNYLALGYGAVALLLLGYGLFLWFRWRRLR
ncbi:MAG: hypothetical protein ACP5VN_02045 [Acidobacteriota bacterium]